MTTTTSRPKTFEAAPTADSQRYLWTRQAFHRLDELGVLAPDARLELIEGELIRKMPKNPPHSIATILASKFLERIFHEGYHVRTQEPFVVSDISEPEPDIAVVAGEIQDYLAEHPSVAALLVEISDSTLTKDRSTKASLYARARVEDYWVLNLIDRVLEIHRQPAPMENSLMAITIAALRGTRKRMRFSRLPRRKTLFVSRTYCPDLSHRTQKNAA